MFPEIPIPDVQCIVCLPTFGIFLVNAGKCTVVEGMVLPFDSNVSSKDIRRIVQRQTGLAPLAARRLFEVCGPLFRTISTGVCILYDLCCMIIFDI